MRDAQLAGFRRILIPIRSWWNSRRLGLHRTQPAVFGTAIVTMRFSIKVKKHNQGSSTQALGQFLVL